MVIPLSKDQKTALAQDLYDFKLRQKGGFDTDSDEFEVLQEALRAYLSSKNAEEIRHRVELDNGKDHPPSCTAATIAKAVAGAVEMAFKEGVKLGRAQERGTDRTPNIGPFFDEDNVIVKRGEGTGETEDGWTVYDWIEVKGMQQNNGGER